jgi:transposase-like protein
MPQLPPENVERWTAKRKAAVIIAVQKGAITVEEACRRYEISEEEFLAWQHVFAAYGLPGLRSTRLMEYRHPPRPPGRRPRR